METEDPVLSAKQALAGEILARIQGKQHFAAIVQLGTSQSRVSRLKHGKLESFSIETLITFLARLGQRVELRVTAAPAPPRRLGKERGGSV